MPKEASEASPPPGGRRAAGHRYESLAEAFLRARGLTRIERNYRCRAGEIDLIMRDGRTVVFVEVRYRRTRSFGGAAASVTREKQRRLVSTARHYLLTRHRAAEPECRFDVVALSGDAATPDIDWIAGAFSA